MAADDEGPNAGGRLSDHAGILVEYAWGAARRCKQGRQGVAAAGTDTLSTRECIDN